MKTFADKAIAYNHHLKYKGSLPKGFQVINPFQGNDEAIDAMTAFYRKFYSDEQKRRFIFGINPGRHGAGLTGIPFTDTKRLESECGIFMKNTHSHEVSSVFVYDMIEAFGGPEAFYSQFYINSPFPLAITRKNKRDKWVNANYYDLKSLFNSVKPYMLENIKTQLDLGLETDEVFVLGIKNARFIEELNDELKAFDKITPLEHPRYIQQYKSKEKDTYIQKYLDAFYGK